MFRRLFAAGLVLAALTPAGARALENVLVNQNGREKQLAGEVLVEARDGGMLLKTADGAYHRLEPQMIRGRTKDSKPLVMLTREQLAEQMLATLPAGFQVHHSKNYVVCYNTTRVYAEWTSSLLERLQKAFIVYWKKRGCEVKEPTQPLVVLVFGDQQSYAQFAKQDLGAAVSSVIGYYNLETNRILMYDLTGMQTLRQQGFGRGSLHDISDMLSQPEAEPLVATIVHEATHQISFNCGLQTRLVDNPLWLSEGLAVFFETPDLSSSRSWSGIGVVNYPRWDRFRDNVDAENVAPLGRMVGDDELFRDPKTAVDMYAQAWAWNYFLIKWRPKEYAAYLKSIAAKPVLVAEEPKRRVAEFRKHFGDLQKLEDDFYRQMGKRVR
jgi:hypothetical protein